MSAQRFCPTCFVGKREWRYVYGDRCSDAWHDEPATQETDPE